MNRDVDYKMHILEIIAAIKFTRRKIIIKAVTALSLKDYVIYDTNVNDFYKVGLSKRGLIAFGTWEFKLLQDRVFGK